MRYLFLPILSLGFSISAIAATPDPVTGPAAVEAFLEAYESQLATSPQRRTELDALCRQLDCDASRLFWHTDLEAAKAAAQESDKPILSLRLLGNLDEDLSCANSRFFRVALYPNSEVSQKLRDRFILHWESVRPVPKVTVDFGDGRTLERTLTGNSIHYILSPEGRPIEAIPGLYGPGAFLRQLQRAEDAVLAYQTQHPAQREDFLRQYHQDRLSALQQQWGLDLQTLNAAGVEEPTLDLEAAIDVSTANSDGLAEEIESFNALDVSDLAISKLVVEAPLVTSVMSETNRDRSTLAELTDRAAWEQLARLYAEDARLDENSRQLVRRKQGGSSEEQLDRTIASFEAAMALDGIRNEYLLHSRLHQWFIDGAGTSDVAGLNERVYAELFLTPSSDPWLGLLGPESFSAIDGNGIRGRR